MSLQCLYLDLNFKKAGAVIYIIAVGFLERKSESSLMQSIPQASEQVCLCYEESTLAKLMEKILYVLISCRWKANIGAIRDRHRPITSRWSCAITAVSLFI